MCSSDIEDDPKTARVVNADINATVNTNVNTVVKANNIKIDPRNRIYVGTENINEIPFYNVSSMPRYSIALLVANRATGKTTLAKYLIKKRNLRHGQTTSLGDLRIYKDHGVDRWDWELFKKTFQKSTSVTSETGETGKTDSKSNKLSYVLFDDIEGRFNYDVDALMMNNRFTKTDVIICAQNKETLSRLTTTYIDHADFYFLGKGSDLVPSTFIRRLILELEPYQFLVYDSVDNRLIGKTNPKEVASLVLDQEDDLFESRRDPDFFG